MNELCFGNFLKKLIKASGMTQVEFYTALGIKKPYFYDILSGHTNPPPYLLQRRAMDILHPNETAREKFYDLAAKDRKELPADIAQFLEKHPEILLELRRQSKQVV